MLRRNPGPLSKQEIYERIKKTSRAEYIYSEMIRLGYWPEDLEKPKIPSDKLNRRKELRQQLREAGVEYGKFKDPEKLLAKMHKQRKAEALKKREETRQKRNQQRFEKAQAWHKKKQEEITWLGEGVSMGLKNLDSQPERLKSTNLPLFKDSGELANAMGISINELRFLTYQRNVSKISHYQHFDILKKSGGTRRISTPMPRLKLAQYWVLDHIIDPIPLHDAAHGFIKGRSILSNANPHVGQDVVVNMDLQNFFPTISYPRVKGLLRGLGYSEHVATVLGLLCTEPEIDIIELDGDTFYTATGKRQLPQGAPTSPGISNIICRNLDKRIQGIADKLNFRYSRYADDLTFSTDKKSAHHLQKLLWRVTQVVEDEGFILHPDKTRIMRNNQRQEVTGIVVNTKPSVDRKTLKRFRALLFQIEKDGIEGKQWGSGALIPSIDGYANFVAMVNPEKGVTLQQRVEKIKLKLGIKQDTIRLGKLNNKALRIAASNSQLPDRPDGWWQPLSIEPPVLEKTPAQVTAEKRGIDIDTAIGVKTKGQLKKEQSNAASKSASAMGRTFIGIGIVVFILMWVLSS